MRYGELTAKRQYYQAHKEANKEKRKKAKAAGAPAPEQPVYVKISPDDITAIIEQVIEKLSKLSGA